MEKKVELECEYCGVSITEDTVKCPNCGANCSSTVKKYKAQKEKERQEKFERNKVYGKEISNDLEQAFVKPVVVMVAIVIFVITISLFLHIVFRKNPNSESSTSEKTDIQENVKVGFNELAETKEYTFILDQYELYEYQSDKFPAQYNTPAGYQKVAFHFQYKNTSKNAYQLGYEGVTLKADGYKVETAELETGMFETAVVGKDHYPEFNATIIKPGDKFQGYVGFLVPKDKKELQFSFKDVTIEMNNPAYQE